jgi:hypothetical protein
MTTWCQNKKCPERKNQNQIRGNKGSKYYQSNKASEYYYGLFCSQKCTNQWLSANASTITNHYPEIDKQIISVENAWYVQAHYAWDREGTHYDYYLKNKLQGVQRLITREQAQTPKQISDQHGWATINNEQAKQLATTLSLAS